MVYGAIDLHMRYSQVRIIDAEGELVRETRVATTPERLTAAFAAHGPMRILLETGTESEWVAQVLETAGHTVVVADPNFAPMYGEVRRHVKTDSRDVTALAEANRRGWYRPAHRTSAVQRERRQLLRARRQLVQMRTGTISVIRALLRQAGYRAGTGSSEAFGDRLARLTLPFPLAATIAPLVRTLATLRTEIRALDAHDVDARSRHERDQPSRGRPLGSPTDVHVPPTEETAVASADGRDEIDRLNRAVQVGADERDRPAVGRPGGARVEGAARETPHLASPSRNDGDAGRAKRDRASCGRPHGRESVACEEPEMCAVPANGPDSTL